MIASQKEAVNKFISVAGVSVPAGKVIQDQIKAQAPMLLDQTTTIIKKIENGETVTEVPPLLHAIFRPSVQPYLISWFKYNPQDEISKLNKDILIIQGTTDIQVETSHAHTLASANKKARKHIFEGMNHI